MHDKHQNIEEPCEGKLSSTVLESSGSREGVADFNTHDRVNSDEFPMTQEFLSQMLGVRRASVSEVAATLQRAGLIHYHRGKIKVLDRKGLEGGSCECYQVVRHEYARLLS